MGEAALGYAARQGESLSAALDDLAPILPPRTEEGAV